MSIPVLWLKECAMFCLLNSNNKYANRNIVCELKYFPAIGDFYHLVITFANSLDTCQDRQNITSDLDSTRLPLCDYEMSNGMRIPTMW